MVGAHLTAVGAIYFPHLLLDEGVPGFAQDGYATVLANEVLRVPGQPRVVDDPRSRARASGILPQAGRRG